jgi:hypothetical protein
LTNVCGLYKLVTSGGPISKVVEIVLGMNISPDFLKDPSTVHTYAQQLSNSEPCFDGNANEASIGITSGVGMLVGVAPEDVLHPRVRLDRQAALTPS